MSEFDIKDGVCLICGYNGGMDIVYHTPGRESCVQYKQQMLLGYGGREAIEQVIEDVLKERGL